MLLKRKRSDSEISTGSSMLSSPGYSSHTTTMDMGSVQIPTPSLFASRTKKRYRDNRPSESEVHQHTLSLLYSAQQNPTQHSPSPSPIMMQEPSIMDPVPSANDNRQSSLHAFWALPGSSVPQHDPSSSTSPNPNPVSVSYLPQMMNCEDCDACLVVAPGAGGDGAMDVDVDMDIDVYGMGGEFGCSACGKQVCHQCAVSNLGEQRMCLVCAGRKKWVGGLGWVTV
ncbi:hypothetical protein F5884DRAFT_667656 [Xylogone sp. PMI_703]|nr:hypothetical protein F5884DRAFT_667656 [Xylogone sp. PMI_703]